MKTFHNSSIEYLFLFVATVTIVLCFDCRTDEEREHEQFLRLNRIQRREAILKRTPEEQVELFMLVMKRQHPKDLGLAEALASNGSDVVPFLLEHLRMESSPNSKCDLLLVFWIMQFNSFYDVSNDAAVVSELEEQVASIQEDYWQGRGEEYLRDIRRGTVLRKQ